MKHLYFVLLIFISFSCNAQHSSILTPEEFKKQIKGKDVQLIDVRTPEEYNAGHISNAVNIDYLDSDFKKKVQKMDKTKPIYVYCQAGGRSGKAAKILVDLGFTKVFDLAGGYGKWKD